MFSIAVVFSLSIIFLCVYHVFRTRIHTTVGGVQALLTPRNTSDADDIRSRIYPHGHLALTPSSDVLDPSLHDGFVTEARTLIASVEPQQSPEGWKKLVKCAEQCTDRFLPEQNINFAVFVQSVTFCTILAGFYDVDLAIPTPEVTFMTNALNRHSDRSRPTNIQELSTMTGHIHSWVNGERAFQALEIILPAYESMWRLAAVTLAHVNGDQHMRNAFLDFSENPTENQFSAFKVKDTKPSVGAIMKEVLRLYPPMCHIMRKRRHPWWRQLFCRPREVADIASAQRTSEYGTQLETFDAMRFHPSQHIHRLLAFGHGGLSCVAEEWAPMATALIVAKVIDRVDDVRFILAGGALNTSVGHNTRTGWDGWVIRKRERTNTVPPQVLIG
jgi:hypothetical protein